MHTEHRTSELGALATRIDCGLPPLSGAERRIALAVHRCMAFGAEPPGPACIAAASGETPQTVEAALAGWPGVYRDDGDRVIGFWGLALRPMMPHRLRVRGRLLHTWCAWDALFLPEVLGVERAEVESVCPATGRPVVLTVTTSGVEDPQPETARLSMVAPDRLCIEGQGIISSFCHHIHFLASPGGGERWIRETGNGAFLITPGQGWELGRLCNRLRYGDALDEACTCR